MRNFWYHWRLPYLLSNANCNKCKNWFLPEKKIPLKCECNEITNYIGTPSRRFYFRIFVYCQGYNVPTIIIWFTKSQTDTKIRHFFFTRLYSRLSLFAFVLQIIASLTLKSFCCNHFIWPDRYPHKLKGNQITTAIIHRKLMSNVNIADTFSIALVEKIYFITHKSKVNAPFMWKGRIKFNLVRVN